jgi:multidrug efflux pump
MTSTSSLGMTNITLQFDLDRNINAAARDVQAAINAARGQLPANLPMNPSYRKINPADAPILTLKLTSETYDKRQMYDVAATILQQKISQVQGVGQIFVGGGSQPAVRVDLNPTILNHLGIGLEEVRLALGQANANRPKGSIHGEDASWSIVATDQLFSAAEYERLIVVYRNGAPVRLKDVATVTDSVENVRAYGISNGKPAVTLVIFRQPGANILGVVEEVRKLLPQLEAQIPAAMNLDIGIDRTSTIRASLEDVQFTLVVSVILVILVVFVFLRDWRATLIPSVAVPVSLIATFGVMYLFDYSLDNLSLMALTIAAGFVVDDAIVVIENIARYIEKGMSPMDASIRGAKEIGFTVLSISVSLIAVFIPVLFMGGIVGRLFREFAVVLSVAITVSLLVSLTTTPMMCAYLLKPQAQRKHGWLYLASERIFDSVLALYGRSLRMILRHPRTTLLVNLATVGLTVYLYIGIPKGFFPQQDTGRMTGNLVADQDTSYAAMVKLLDEFSAIVADDPAIQTVEGSIGGGFGGASNSARLNIALKPLHLRKLTPEQVSARIRVKTSKIPGATLMLQSVQDLRIGGRSSSAQYQYSLRGDSLEELDAWGAKLLAEMRKISSLVDVSSDQQNRGLQTKLEIDRAMAARLGVTLSTIDNTLYDAFGQRQVSTMYKSLNQYRVVMQVEDRFSQSPDALQLIFVHGPNDEQIPLKSIYRQTATNASLSANHSGQFPSTTISFNLAPGASLGQVIPQIEEASRKLAMPESIQGKFAGAAQAFQDSLSTQPLLILAALVTVYIVLGILYESYIHPITILSTLPSAGVGALLALIICNTELSVMAMIGILLLIGIVKKNAIMMIDFALEAERSHDRSPEDAILEACLMRFRPIIMTTMAALFAGLPLALGAGNGAELRQPLGIAIVGGLIFSQLLTLYTTPVVYLYLDRLRWAYMGWAVRRPRPIYSASA